MTVPAVEEFPIRLGRAPRDRVVDALFFLLAAVFTVFGVVDGVQQHVAPVPLAVDAALGGLSCLGLWLRRRWPVGVAVIVGLSGIYATSGAVAGLDRKSGV